MGLPGQFSTQINIPLAQKVQQTFPSDAVAVLGLHTVFEHHAAMTPVSLQAFLHEYRITFPVGVDAAGDGPLPKTMQAYKMRGTPSMLILDKTGALRAHFFGEVSELRLGAEIATLLGEDVQLLLEQMGKLSDAACDEEGCSL